jgi:hypothetical protein
MKNNKQTINKKRVDKLFDSFLKEDLLEDRSEYDEEDLQLAYPKLNKKEVKLLYLKIQKWKYSKEKKKRPNKIKIVDDCE